MKRKSVLSAIVLSSVALSGPALAQGKPTVGIAMPTKTSGASNSAPGQQMHDAKKSTAPEHPSMRRVIKPARAPQAE
jgi:hypothetical protein